jgi:hypothetical protein
MLSAIPHLITFLKFKSEVDAAAQRHVEDGASLAGEVLEALGRAATIF